jgi:hypothetical protein
MPSLEVEGLSDDTSSPPREADAWSPPDVSDMGTAFDSLNLSRTQPTPSTVTIETLPQGSAPLLDMLRMPQHMAGSAGALPCPSPSNPGRVSSRRNEPLKCHLRRGHARRYLQKPRAASP